MELSPTIWTYQKPIHMNSRPVLCNFGGVGWGGPLLDPYWTMAKWRWGRSQWRRSGNPKDPRAHGTGKPQGTPGPSATSLAASATWPWAGAAAASVLPWPDLAMQYLLEVMTN